MRIDSLIAAQNLGKVGDEVIKLTEKVRKILTGGCFSHHVILSAAKNPQCLEPTGSRHWETLRTS